MHCNLHVTVNVLKQVPMMRRMLLAESLVSKTKSADAMRHVTSSIYETSTCDAVLDANMHFWMELVVFVLIHCVALLMNQCLYIVCIRFRVVSFKLPIVHAEGLRSGMASVPQENLFEAVR